MLLCLHVLLDLGCLTYRCDRYLVTPRCKLQHSRNKKYYTLYNIVHVFYGNYSHAGHNRFYFFVTGTVFSYKLRYIEGIGLGQDSPRPIRSLRYIVTCKRLWAQVSIENMGEWEANTIWFQFCLQHPFNEQGVRLKVHNLFIGRIQYFPKPHKKMICVGNCILPPNLLPEAARW